MILPDISRMLTLLVLIPRILLELGMTPEQVERQDMMKEPELEQVEILITTLEQVGQQLIIPVQQVDTTRELVMVCTK